MRFNDKVNARLLDALGEGMELVDGQAYARVWNWNFIAIDGIVIVHALVIIADPVTNLIVKAKTKKKTPPSTRAAAWECGESYRIHHFRQQKNK
jgi:hypothetical protein